MEVRTEYENLARQLELTDVGKLLLTFECTKEGNEDMGENELDGVIYLLTTRQILPFGYPFLLNPLPFSSRLREDVYTLIQTGYLNKRNPIYITQKGSHWVSALLRQYNYGPDILSGLVQAIRELLTEYRRQAFEVIYTAMSL